jgi:hypothetical protein
MMQKQKPPLIKNLLDSYLLLEVFNYSLPTAEAMVMYNENMEIH